MKAKIVVTDPKKGTLEIPLKKKEIAAFFDMGFMLSNDTANTLELNEIDKDIYSLHHKIEYLLNDVIHEGKVYQFTKTGLKLRKERYYLVRKPKWAKEESK